MFDYKKIISSRELRLKILNALRFIPDEPYIKLLYRIRIGKRLNLKNPKTLCEKLNWLKLHQKNDFYTQLVDKVAVRDVVISKLGEDICFPLYGVWEHYDEIDFDKLPDKFVLKCNHDSGSVKIVKDKNSIDHKAFHEFFESRLRENPYAFGREYPYKNVPPRIFAEQYMVPDGEQDINDYKFYCFNGKPEFLYIVTDRYKDCRFDFYDMDYKHMDITHVHEQSGKEIEKPSQFEKMKEIAAKLSEGIPFVRIDLYEIGGKVYFGEYTFYPGCGFEPLKPEEWEYKMGKLLDLNLEEK